MSNNNYANTSANANRNSFNFQHSLDRALLNIYVDMYNTTSREIDRLYDNLDEIRNAIHNLEINHRNLNSNIRHHSNQPRARNSNRRSENINVPVETIPSQIYLNGRYYNVEYVSPNLNTETDTRRRDFLRNGIYNILDNLFTQENFQSFNEPVIVRPSMREIQNSTINTTFGSINNPINSSCPISLERFEDESEVSQIIHCGHVFNTSDLNVWFERNVRCPVCRYDIRRYSRTSRSPSPRQTSSTPNNVRETANVDLNSLPDPVFQNENISNIQYNENGDITFDISMNPLVNLATQALNDLIRNPQPGQNVNNFFDPSNNAFLLFETILRRQP